MSAQAGGMTADMQGEFTADHLEAIAFWMRNPEFFGDAKSN